jgi:hypothetical protein
MGGAVDPSLVSGRVTIGNSDYLYSRGVLDYGGMVYLVSDDEDLVIESVSKKPVGSIVNGFLVPLAQLPQTQRQQILSKYGV